MLASDAASQDPIDLAVLTAAGSHDIDLTDWKRLELIPFDPATKLSEAIVNHGTERWRAIKGAPEQGYLYTCHTLNITAQCVTCLRIGFGLELGGFFESGGRISLFGLSNGLAGQL